MKIKIYGSRGTMPFFSRENIFYGGNTACVRVDALGRTMILDCGSGLFQLTSDLFKEAEPGRTLELDILISHLHLDHIIGLSGFYPTWNEKNNIRIFTKSRDDRPLSEQVYGAFKPPYWPVALESLNRAKMIEIYDNNPFMLGDRVKVTPFLSGHQDETTVFRIDADKSLVYLLDYETDGNLNMSKELISYCKNADIILFDSTYLPEDYESKRGWGHSSYEAGMRLAELSGCAQMVFCHFYQMYSDGILHSLAENIDGKKYKIASDGMELEI